MLLVVQPSSLDPQQLTNLVEAVQAGVPTAIFEDRCRSPFPAFREPVSPSRRPGGMFGGGPPPPKGDMRPLWNALGLVIPPNPGFQEFNPDIVWQQYNRIPSCAYLLNATDQWLFIRQELGDEDHYLSNTNQATAGLRELMFLYAGAVEVKSDPGDLRVEPIVRTRPNSGRIKFEDVMNQLRSNETNLTQLQVLQGPAIGEQTIAVYVEGTAAVNAAAEEEGQEDSTSDRRLRAFYVADIDCMAPFFSANRRRPEDYEDINLRVQNITFVLNIIAVLAGETNCPAIRKH